MRRGGVVVRHPLTAAIEQPRLQGQTVGVHQPRGLGVVERVLTVVHRLHQIQAERCQIELTAVERQPEHLLTLFQIEGQGTHLGEAGEAAGVGQGLRLGIGVEVAILLEGRGDRLAT